MWLIVLMVCWRSIWFELKKQAVMKTQVSYVKCSRPVSCRTHVRFLLIYILKVYFVLLYGHLSLFSLTMYSCICFIMFLLDSCYYVVTCLAYLVTVIHMYSDPNAIHILAISIAIWHIWFLHSYTSNSSLVHCIYFMNFIVIAGLLQSSGGWLWRIWWHHQIEL
jgi:hypothetical protein